LATAESRILVTIDTDFGELVFRHGSVHSGIIRLPDLPAVPRIATLRTVLAYHADALLAGALVTVRGARIRVSLPPGQPPNPVRDGNT
jgi:predicted nuclease of predicted toxin-antitoxin system